ncbi:Holliday junction branch migration protein RuvA [Patescibacteria group bacterium]|nr:Holliday junction branch migration protein RuvA [Patescibacteria group bacterium]
MIAFLQGIVAEIDIDSTILDVHGVGYRVAVARPTFEVGETVKLYIYEIIREDKHDLCGFSHKEDLALFEALIGVQGIGQKVAMKILSTGSSEKIIESIAREDVGFFGGISGIGKKTAQKIILELKGVLVSGAPGGMMRDDVTEALEGIGYSKEDIQAVLEHVPAHGGTEVRLKEALKILGAKR